jgi:hypothetical protein
MRLEVTVDRNYVYEIDAAQAQGGGHAEVPRVYAAPMAGAGLAML